MALNVKSFEGSELAAGDYARKAPTRGSFGEAWEVFKNNFGKVVLINLLMLIFALPAVAAIIVRVYYIGGMGALFPFNSNTGVGYPAYPGTQGLTEGIYLNADLVFNALLVAAGLIASVGFAGGAYSVKKLLSTGGEFTFKGFFRGVRLCYFRVALPLTVFLLFYYAATLVGDWMHLEIALGNPGGGPITAYVFIIIAAVLVGLYCAWALAVGVTYKLSFGKIIKGAFAFLIASPLQTVLIAGLALTPVWIYLIGTAVPFIAIIAYALFILFGFTFILLAWISFTQWVFDRYITPEFKASAEDARAKKTPRELERDKRDEEKRIALELLAAGKSELIGRPILPVSDGVAVEPLGEDYSREGLKRVGEQRARLLGEVAEYERAHKNDAEYAEYNKLFADREKALQTTGKKQKKKKVSADNLLR